MKWRKLGRIFTPSGERPWMQSHAANTVAEHLEGDLFRIYFSCRDGENRSHIACVLIELKPPFQVLEISKEPILDPGELGTFDDSGVSLACIRAIGGRKFLYYLGWNLGVTVPWRNSIGLAILDETSEKYVRYSKAPLLDRNDVDPFSVSYPFVMEDAGIYRMWYGSNLKWGPAQEDMAHLIKYAESTDGLKWKRDGTIALRFKDKSEYAMSRPFVVKENGIYRMWYSYRGTAYRIGYAESENAVDWKRMDEKVGISVSDSGWDSESIEYPFLIDHRGQRYMFYNGNGYGRTGFGLAVLE
ncbi:MAG: hypothetical protein GTO24_07630 [candidate division Zixibacteria bacterium]|nr:hypothetical protein [candidate division Zixibacteria bacterium]